MQLAVSKKRRLKLALGGSLAVAAFGVASSAGAGVAAAAACKSYTPVTLQLQWQTQAQFAGYIEAGVDGYYKQECLNVTIVPAASDTVPQLTVADGGKADFAVAWVPKALQSRQQGADIEEVAQVFQRSGTLQISFKKNPKTGAAQNLTTPASLKGTTVGDWGYGDEYELFAGLTKAGLDPATDVTHVQQAFTMDGFLEGDMESAQAMIYNEYALVLESINPATGKLYQPSDLNVINWNKIGTAMLQDGIWVNAKKLKTKAFQQTTTRFLTAAFHGWIDCGAQPVKCAKDTVAAGKGLAPVHQLWMMNQVNQLIWPSPQGIGIVNSKAWNQTVKIAEKTKGDTTIDKGASVLNGAPAPGAYTNTYAQQALAALKKQGLNVTGKGYKPITVKLTKGGLGSI
jgi:NitT/TauT family transport system substrate-binding protein